MRRKYEVHEKDDEELEVLVDLGDWVIVRYTDHIPSQDPLIEVYAEHVNGCSRSFNSKTCNWCWEYSDSTPNRPDDCWMCKKPVPKEVVALVALYNWNKSEE